MKVTRVTPLVLGSAWCELLFVKVETAEGITGWGEVRPLNKTQTVLGYLAEAAPRYLVGRNPFDTERLVYEMMLGHLGRPTGERIQTPCDPRELFELQACDILQTDLTHFVGLACRGARTGRIFRAPKARHVSAQANGLGLGQESRSGLKGRDIRPV